ncbi:hypothetical protein EZV62_021310 [Acer yangbiense]|uniref:Uncharacterized protein n=1 Tax=Acer yangbiense TaxID=1000413 RepID=A0A5C7H5A0_9ROSI|nr:hypothetical protein EZV62_021310 [Acer yangbiense]
MGWKESAVCLFSLGMVHYLVLFVTLYQRLSGSDRLPVMLRPICRPTLFKRSMRSFNVAWWAYSFPLTMLALSSTEYAQQVKGTIAHLLMLVLSALSVLVALCLTLFTLLNTTMLLPENDPFATLDFANPDSS